MPARKKAPSVAVLRSPNEMIQASKDVMLDGREPQSYDDWILIINFLATNIAYGLEESATLLLRDMYDIPVDDDTVRKIAEFQKKQKKKGDRRV